MPLIRIQHPNDAITSDQKQRLAERLTQLLLRIEGGHDTPSSRSLAYVLFTGIDRGDWFVGGLNDLTHQAGRERLIVDVMVPEASTTQTMKSEIHAGVQTALNEVLQWSQPGDGASAWILIHEVPEGHWGVQGETVGLARIAAVAEAPPDAGRTEFIKSYFKAKATAFAAAGYPADVSGQFRRPEPRS